jgi:pentatricopeptide repeat protein
MHYDLDRTSYYAYTSLQDSSVKPGWFFQIQLSRFIHGGPSDLINIFLKRLQEVAPDSSIYNAVIHGLCLRGKTGLANKVYAKMRSMGLVPDGKTRAFMLQHIATD